MKFKVLSLLGVLAFSAGSVIQAQDYDDIYYDGSSNTKVATEKRTTRVSTTAMQVPARYKVTVQKNYQVDRDVDEYNRRGDYADEYADTLAHNPADADVFSNTERIERFYNPDIVVLSNDPELVELYFDSRPSINLVIGSNYGYVPRIGWGWGYGNYWYDPWYASLYDPWYSIYDPFYRPWGWYGWSRPYFCWGWSWGWHGSWYYAGWGWGWGRSWYAGRGWDHHGWNHHGWNGNGGRYHAGVGGRRPGDHRSMLDGSTNHRYTSRAGAGSSGVGRAGSVTNGRQRPSAYGSGYRSGATTNRQRPSSTMGNTDSYNRGSGWSGGSVRNRSTSSGYSSSPSRTRSTSGYSSGSSSRSYSSGSSSHSYSGGGYSGGSSRGGGGFSGGGGHSGGGGGGGHRR